MAFSLLAIVAAAPAARAQRGSDAEPLIGKFRNTWYFLAHETDYGGVKKYNIRDMDNRIVGKVSATFKRHLTMEGSGKLASGRVLTYQGKAGGTVRFEETRHDYGRGVGNCSLIPWGTIAADPTYIPLGSVVRIDETVGMPLPNGSIHDGLWKVEDIGSAIKRDHIDIFVGAGEANGPWLARNGIINQQALTVRMVRAPMTPSCVDERPE